MIFSSLIADKRALVIILLSIIINYIYSLPPFKLSYRTLFAPVILSFAYVIIPFLLGVVITNIKIKHGELFFIFGLFLLFLGRIILKDFRDRKGDSLHGKITFLLKFGKNKTCLLSIISVFLGSILLFIGLPVKNLIILFVLELYIFAIFFALYRLYKATEYIEEQANISIGARMGNGFLLTILGFLILLEYQASIEIQTLFVFTTTAIFLVNFFIWIRSKKDLISDYKG